MTQRTDTRPRTQADYARQAAMDAPTPRQIKAYHDAMLPYDATPLRTGTFRGCSVAVYRSPYDPAGTMLLVCADAPPNPDGTPGRTLSEEVANDAAVDAWLRATL